MAPGATFRADLPATSGVGIAGLSRLPAALVMLMLGVYKRWVSPALPPSCRFVPSCSDYAAEAVERYGALRGVALTVWRLLRCNPLAKGGYDPVVCDPVVKDGDGCAAEHVKAG